MNIDQFLWWCQGFFEVSNPKTVNEQQFQEIINHIELVKSNLNKPDWKKELNKLIKKDKKQPKINPLDDEFYDWPDLYQNPYYHPMIPPKTDPFYRPEIICHTTSNNSILGNKRC